MDSPPQKQSLSCLLLEISRSHTRQKDSQVPWLFLDDWVEVIVLLSSLYFSDLLSLYNELEIFV